MKIVTEMRFERGHEIAESSFVVVHRAGLPFMLEEDRARFLEEIKQISIRKVEESVLEHVFEHINEQVEERRNPSYMGFCIYETPCIEQGKPVVIMHPADMVDLLGKGAIIQSSASTVRKEE